MKLDGRKILITGGGSGIGLELARRLSDSNDVVIAGRDVANLERARSETPALRTLRLDVTSEDEASSAIAWFSSELGGLDLLVNNAACSARIRSRPPRLRPRASRTWRSMSAAPSA
jgi:uncharacterized oxidoreductase